MSAMKMIGEIIEELENIYIPQIARKFENVTIEGYYDAQMNYVIEASKGHLNITKNIELRCDMDLDKEMIEVENFIKYNLYTEEFNTENDDFSKFMNAPIEAAKTFDEAVKEAAKNFDDAVNHPSHYTSGAHECIDVMEAMFGTEAVISFCKCNIFKYRFRADKKNGEEDIKKAEWYESKLMELEKKFKKLDDDEAVIPAKYY